jgi:hypothetical protein
MTKKEGALPSDQGGSDKVLLVVNGHQEDREAVVLMDRAGVGFVLAGPVAGQVTPAVFTPTARYYGLPGVRDFLQTAARENAEGPVRT